jgi:hypothetical protein
MKPLAALWLAVAIISPPPQAPVAPIDVVLMVDVSGSITQGVFKRDTSLVTDAASALASAIARGDAARIGTFGNEIRLAPAALSDADGIHKAASRLTAAIGGASPLWDALDTAADALSTARVASGRSEGSPRERSGVGVPASERVGEFEGRSPSNDNSPRRGIIVLTDGRSSANRISFGDVLTKLEAARVAVFAIGLESGGSTEPNPAARLSYLADVTGGTFRPVKRKDVAAAVKEAVAALRAGATVTAR